MSKDQINRSLQESNFLQEDDMKVDIRDVARDMKMQMDSDTIMGDAVEQNAQNVIADQIGSIGIQLVKQSDQVGLHGDCCTDITIGDALEATALTAKHQPVSYSDAAAIQAAEERATGHTNYIVPGGIAAAAQMAAKTNAQATNLDDKMTLGQILSNASSKLPSDHIVTREDAEGVMVAELQNDPNMSTRSGGVATSIVVAARLNESN